MKNLQRLASEHRTESQLFSGNGIERMYQLLLQQLSNKIAFHNMEIFFGRRPKNSAAKSVDPKQIGGEKIG